jgi:tRNA uridine 5-carboxymethylaminomethyl modification enzyme
VGEDEFDVLVVGGGHAGCEAFAAACRMGVRSALVIPRLSEAGCQPCNPAVGGVGKGHLVREVVALGGLMGSVTDRTGLQFRTLNTRRGPAVRATRVQTDSGLYMDRMADRLALLRGVILEDRAVGLAWTGEGRGRRVLGVHLERRGLVKSRTVVVATGTFLRGMLFIGSEITPGGRRGAPPSIRFAESLEQAGLPLLRLKTGTCPRLDASTVDFDATEPQPGDTPEPFFDPETRSVSLPQLSCHLTYTGDETHEVVRRNLHRSALYSGAIEGIGPRYCPSFETKIAKFPDKERHQVFLEPEDQHRRVIYPSGLPTSLPRDVQDAMVRSIPGLRRARIVRYGYAVEYDAVQPLCLCPSLEVDGVRGLFLAGQILGTSGYEEAAALGLVSGANAVLSVRGDAPLVLSRDQAYSGVMIDDLTTQGVDEPYRMFTSRAEFRLLLREDNADERLLGEGIRCGLTPPGRASAIQQKTAAVNEAKARLSQVQLNPSAETQQRLSDAGLPPVAKPVSLFDYLRRSEVRLADLSVLEPWIGGLESAVAARVEVDVKYAGYLDRQQTQAEKLRHVDGVVIPDGIALDGVPGLRPELVEKLKRVRPKTLGQASRIPGVTPAAIQILHVLCERAASKPRISQV